MIGFLVPWLIKKGISSTIAPKLAKGGVIVLGVLLGIAAFFLWLHLHDQKVVSTNDAQVIAKSEAANRKSDEHAANARLSDQKRRDAEAAQLSTILNMGAPDATRDPASVHAAQRAFYRCLRQQRASREAGGPPATCGP